MQKPTNKEVVKLKASKIWLKFECSQLIDDENEAS